MDDVIRGATVLKANHLAAAAEVPVSTVGVAWARRRPANRS
jgi:hypothetical protein